MFEFLLLLINILLGKVYNTVCSFKMFFLFNIFLNTFALMHLDSLCAYLVFFCFFIIILVLLCRLLLFLFSCDLFKVFFLLNFQIISRVTLFPLFILLQLLNICLLASVHLTISVCCSSLAVLSDAVYQFNYEFPLPVGGKLSSNRLFVFFLLRPALEQI